MLPKEPHPKIKLFSARCLGIYASGVAKRDAAEVATGSPHCEQNLAPAGSSLRHLAQTDAR
jgi:hypothetical protein